MNEEQLDKIHTYRRGDESNEGTRGSGESDLSWMKLAYRTFTQQPRVKAVDKPSSACCSRSAYRPRSRCRFRCED